MKTSIKLSVPAAMFVAAAFLVTTTDIASAREFCRQDVTGHMTGCGFDTMEQCKEASLGIGGDCFREPRLAANATNGGKNTVATRHSKNPSNAFAYAPGAKVGREHGNDANTNN